MQNKVGRAASANDNGSQRECVKYWEIIADNLKNAGWSWGCVSALDCEGRTIWIADAHRGDGKRFVVRADEKLIAFIELQSAIKVEQWFMFRRKELSWRGVHECDPLVFGRSKCKRVESANQIRLSLEFLLAHQ